MVLILFQNGRNAAALNIAEQYVDAFSKLAKESNTLLLPSNTGDVSTTVAEAMTIYHKLAPSVGKVASEKES